MAVNLMILTWIAPTFSTRPVPVMIIPIVNGVMAPALSLQKEKTTRLDPLDLLDHLHRLIDSLHSSSFFFSLESQYSFVLDFTYTLLLVA